MTDDTNSVPATGSDSDPTRSVPLLNADEMTALLVDTFNDMALGALKSWSSGSGRRSEAITALRDLLGWLGPLAASDTLGLWVARRLASAAGLAMAVASRVDDADDSEDVSMAADGADVLSTQVVDTDRVWMSLDDAARLRWRERLPQRIAAVSVSPNGDLSDAVVELASCAAVAAASAIHGARDAFDSPSIDENRILAAICPGCGTANQLTQSTAGWATVRGIDLAFEVAMIGESVAAERGDVMCHGCLGEFSEDEVVRASISFEAAAASR